MTGGTEGGGGSQHQPCLTPRSPEQLVEWQVLTAERGDMDEVQSMRFKLNLSLTASEHRVALHC